MRILSVRLSRLGVLALAVMAVLFVLASPAGAVTPSSPSTTPLLTVDAALVALIAGIVIPLLNGLVTKLTASPTLKSIIAILLAAVTAIGASVAGVHGAVSVKDMIVVGLLALVSAAGHRFTWLSPVERKLSIATANAGVGGTKIDKQSSLYTDHH